MKKILIVSPTATHPVQGGSSACILAYCRLLREEGHKVTFLWIKNFMVGAEEELAMRRYWGKDLIVFRKNFFHKLMEAFHRRLFFYRSGFFRLDSFYPWGISPIVRRTLKQHRFDTVIVNYVFLSRLFRFFKGSRKLLYTHDVFSLKYQKTGQPWFSLRPADERKGLNRADCILAIQNNEALFFKSLTQRPVITTYSYFDFQETPYVEADSLLYLGGSNSYNVESVLWFIDMVYKPLRDVLEGQVTLLIAGKICQVLDDLANVDGVQLLGEVEDVGAFYSRGNIVVNPTFNGTGLKIKSFEALSYGKVVVSHAHGIDGIFRPEACPIFSCTQPNEFLVVLKSLMREKELVMARKAAAVKYMSSFQTEVKHAFMQAINY